MGFRLNAIQYVFNRSNVLELELQEKLAYMRYHRVDEEDMLELIIAKARYDLINEISKDLINLLEISK